MKLQHTVVQPFFYLDPEPVGLLPAFAVNDNVIGVPLKWYAGIFPPHPFIERIMQKKIRQQRADYPPLAGYPAHEL